MRGNMRNIYIRPHLTIDEIEKRRDSTKHAQQYKRWQVIWLAAQGIGRTEAIARSVGIPPKTVSNWISLYNTRGPEAYVLKPRGGSRRRLFSDVQEQEFLAHLEEEAARGEITTLRQVHPRIEAHFGRKVGKGFARRMVRRHTWRPVMPRPEHPRKNAQEQEDFKKNFRTWYRLK
jgi:transposase